MAKLYTIVAVKRKEGMMKRRVVQIIAGLFAISCAGGGGTPAGDGDIERDRELSDTLCEEVLGSIPRAGEPCPYSNYGEGGVAICTGEESGGCVGHYINCQDGFWHAGEIWDDNCAGLVGSFELCCGCAAYTHTCQGG